MAGFTHEVLLQGVNNGVPVAHVYHVFDGSETEDPDDIADVFENNHIPDLVVVQDDHITWSRLTVTPLDLVNIQAPVTRVIALTGAVATDALPTGVHLWVKFISDDNGFKSGGKLFCAFGEVNVTEGGVETAYLASVQTIYDDLITDLVAAGVSLAIYRPTLSIPGVPVISICSNILVRGIGTNNRRQAAYQL